MRIESEIIAGLTQILCGRIHVVHVPSGTSGSRRTGRRFCVARRMQRLAFVASNGGQPCDERRVVFEAGRGAPWVRHV